MTFVARETEKPRGLIERRREALHFVEFAADAVDQATCRRSSRAFLVEPGGRRRSQTNLEEAGAWRLFGCVTCHGITCCERKRAYF